MRKSLLAVALFAAWNVQAAEGDLRLEIAGGKCQHRLAEDSSWHYRYGGYEINMPLDPSCLQIGFSTLPFHPWEDFRWGFRFAYVDLGKITANNTYPIDEPKYFEAKKNGTAVDSETARFHGRGYSRGITLGFAGEYSVSKSLRLGGEVGVAALYTIWRTTFNHAQAVQEGCRQDWACADGLKWTLYVGATIRYDWLYVGVRQYDNVHASQSAKNPLFIGPTTGPVTAVMAGLSIPFN